MPFTYDLATDIGKARLLIPDTDSTNVLFSDEEYTAFLSLEGGSIRRAAALALETLASNEAYVQKVMRVLDLQTNGAATAQALMTRAAALRTQALADDLAEVDGSFDIAEWVLDPFGRRERLVDQAVRTYG